VIRVLAFLALAPLFLSGCQSLQGQQVEPEVSLLRLEVGTCLNDVEQPIGQDMTNVPLVPCDEPHESEVFAEVALEADEFPGIDAITEEASTRCLEEFSRFIGLDYQDSQLSFHYYYPTETSWSLGDRSIFCVGFEPGTMTIGTLAGAQR
jgi:hypothetical protein